MVVFYNMTENEVKNFSNFHLSIEILEDKLAFLLVNKTNGKPIAIEHLDRQNSSLKEVFDRSEIISKSSPESVSCAIVNSYFSLIPNAIFSESKVLFYLSSCVELPKNYTATEDKHTKRDIVSCYGISTELKKELLSVFPSAQFKHISSILCDSLQDGFHVNFSTENHFEVIVIQNKELHFFNRFTIENKDESFYYLTLIAEKLSLKLAKTRISVSGIVDKNGAILSFWNQFLPKENLTFNEVEITQLNAISTHNHFTLHKQYSCV